MRIETKTMYAPIIVDDNGSWHFALISESLSDDECYFDTANEAWVEGISYIEEQYELDSDRYQVLKSLAIRAVTIQHIQSPEGSILPFPLNV